MGGGNSKAKDAAKEPLTSLSMITKSHSMMSMGGKSGDSAAPHAPMERGKTFSEGSHGLKQPGEDLEFGEVARAWGIFFAQYPKDDTVHGGALFVLRLKDGGPADVSEQAFALSPNLDYKFLNLSFLSPLCSQVMIGDNP